MRGIMRMIHRTLTWLRGRSRRKRYQQIQSLMKIECVSDFILDLGGGPAGFFAIMFPRSEQIILIDIDYDLSVAKICGQRWLQPSLATDTCTALRFSAGESLLRPTNSSQTLMIWRVKRKGNSRLYTSWWLMADGFPWLIFLSL
jgi:hypothetical protein